MRYERDRYTEQLMIPARGLQCPRGLLIAILLTADLAFLLGVIFLAVK